MTSAARPVRAAPGSAAFLAIVDRAVPARPGHDHSRPMCAAWDDHLHRTHFFTLTGPAYVRPWPLGSASSGWVSAGLADVDFPTGLAPHPDRIRHAAEETR